MDKFDFSFPKNMFGFHSSWNNAPGRPVGRRFYSRRPVKLAKLSECDFFRFDGTSLSAGKIRNWPIPCLVKTSTQSKNFFCDGLSSGLGSALIRLDGVTYRLKRCGYKNRPPSRKVHFPFNISFSYDKDVVESFCKSYSGAITYSSALHECQMAKLLNHVGLCLGCEPLGIFRLPKSRNYPKNCSILILKITSDLRLDELIFASLTPLLLELLRSRKLIFSKAMGIFYAKNICFREIYCEYADIFNFIAHIAECSGKNYRRLHDSGFLRGCGSAWSGNEIVHPGGQISFVDFDGGTIPFTQLPNNEVRDLSARETYTLL